MQLRESRDVHRCEHHVAGSGREDADSHRDARRHGERCRGLRDAPAEAEVFDDPEFIEPEILCPAGEVDELIDRKIAWQKHTDAVGG